MTAPFAEDRAIMGSKNSAACSHQLQESSMFPGLTEEVESKYKLVQIHPRNIQVAQENLPSS